MKKILTYIFIFVSIHVINAQDSLLVGKKYLEDQIYFGINYNILNNKPEGLEQKGMSTNYQVGFIKDFPLNKRGTTALGLGMGYAYNKYNQTLKITTDLPEYEIIDVPYNKNKAETHLIEIPFEIRFRGSSPTITKFWRLYFGGKIGYIFSSRSIYTDDSSSIIVNSIPHINKWQYGPQIAFGYGTWNIYTYFNMKELFEDAPIYENIDINKMKSFKIGLQFYIF